MVPTTPEALLVLLAAVLPGAIFAFSYERRAGAYTVSLGDRPLRFVATSAVFAAAYAPPLFLLRRTLVAASDGRRFALAWALAVAALGLPALLGTFAASLTSARGARGPRWRRVLAGYLARRHQPPRAWDFAFAARAPTYVRVYLTDGTAFGGRFAEASYAGTFPHDGDLFLEEAWPIRANGRPARTRRTYGLYIPAASILTVELLRGAHLEEVPDG